jgi:two-component system, LytTR family, response regulator
MGKALSTRAERPRMDLRTLIVDDERIVRQRLRRILSAEDGVEVVDECVDGQEALTAVERHHPDLMLLDIGLPGMDGFEVVKTLGRRRLPLIVLVTGYDEYAIRAFEACALDYLVKPSSPERIRTMLERVRERLALLRGLPPEKESAVRRNRRFSVRSGQRTVFVTPEQIDWIEASGNYVILHVGKENHFLREFIARFEAELSPADFVRVSRSAIVRIDRAKAIQTSPGGHHSIVLINGQHVPITRGIREMEARLRGS